MEITHPSLAGFTWWVEERERIREKKDSGAPHPLTADPILSTYRFCNVYRIDDAVSRWLKLNIWNQPRSWQLLANVIVHRTLSRLDTCKHLGFLKSGTMLMRKFHKRKAAGFAWGTASFHTVPSERRWQTMADFCFNKRGMIKLLEELTSCEAAYNVLLKVPSVGTFLAWQITADLMETEILKGARDRFTFAVPGPGAREGLKSLGATQDLAGITTVMAYHNKHSQIKLDVKDTQHSLCEYNKYEYTLAGRAHPRMRYNPK